jgi:malate dehydrogenase
VKVLVVGNPANTNAYIAMKSAPDLNRRRISPRCCASTTTARCRSWPPRRVAVADIEKLVVWGNHSPTMYPDYRFATVGGASLKDKIGDADWNREHLHPESRQARRGHHRSARPVVRRLGGQCGDRPHPRLGAGHRTASG